MVSRNPVATNNIIISFSREKILRISKPENAIKLKDFIEGDIAEEDIFIFSTRDSSLLSFDHQYAFAQAVGAGAGFQTKTKIELLDTDSVFLEKFVIGGLEALTISGKLNTRSLQPSVYIMFGSGDDFRFWSSPFVAVLSDLEYNFTATGAKKIAITFVANDSGFGDSNIGDQTSEERLQLSRDIKAPIFASETPLFSTGRIGSLNYTWKYVIPSVHTLIVGVLTKYLRTILNSQNVIFVVPDLDILLFEKANNTFENINRYLSANKLAIQQETATVIKRLLDQRLDINEELDELAALDTGTISSYFNRIWGKLTRQFGSREEITVDQFGDPTPLAVFKASKFEQARFILTLNKVFSDLGFIVSKDTADHNSANAAIAFEFSLKKSVEYTPVDGTPAGTVGGKGKFGMVYNIRIPVPTNTRDVLSPVLDILNNIKASTQEKILNPIAFWENNIELINFIAGKFKGKINIDPSKPLLLIGDRDMIINIVYGQASTAKNFNTSIGNLLPQKKDVFFNVFNNESYLEEVFGFTGGKGKKGYFDRLDSANLPDEFTFDETDEDNLKKFNIPIFKGGTTNSNILEVNINSQKTLLLSMVTSYTEALKNLNTLTSVDSSSVDNPLVRDQVKNSIKNLLLKYKNYSPLAGQVRLAAKNQSPDLDILSDQLADNFVNASHSRGLLKVFNKYKESTVAGYLAFIISILRLRYTGSIKTLPMFGVSDSYLVNWPCLMFLIDPNFIVTDSESRVRTFLDTFYTGVWNIVGYRHVITSSDAFSQFLLVKDMMNMPHAALAIENAGKDTQASFEKLTSSNSKENNEDEMKLEDPLLEEDNIDIGSVDIDSAGGSRGVVDGEGEENIIFGEDESVVDGEETGEIFKGTIKSEMDSIPLPDDTLTAINSEVFLTPVEAQKILVANPTIKNAIDKFGTTIDDINIFNDMLIFITNGLVAEGQLPVDAIEQAEKEVEAFAEYMSFNGVENAINAFELNNLSEK